MKVFKALDINNEKVTRYLIIYFPEYGNANGKILIIRATEWNR